MKIYIKKIKVTTKPKFLFFIMMVLFSNSLFADGSKDLYPNGKTGRRAYLRAHNVANANWPFANHGTHYVYAEVGEVITLASSAQNTGGNARIRLFSPSGTQVVDNTTDGVISNRAAELGGPRYSGQPTGGNRYVPIYHSVTTTGIYRVEFVARGTADPGTSYDADASWSEANDAGIRAWDVSIYNATSHIFIPGRVYTNVLNLTNGTTNPNTTGFYGVLNILTKDGYTYKVNNNGNNGMYFTFMVNNNGFINGSGNPVYTSLNTTTLVPGQVHNPNTADTAMQITHKIFYTLPSTSLPLTANGAVPGVSTWLKNTVTEPNASNVQILGVDGTPAQVSNKGGYIRFTADTQGSYTIIIESMAMPAGFATRTLAGIASAGVNNVLWDGKDGIGNSLPPGNLPVKVTVKLKGAEVHFPFFDMEYNRLGTIIELLDYTNLNNVVSDIIYWNDTGISAPGNGTASTPINNSHLPPVNSSGISSGGYGGATTVNGHTWGIGGSGTSGQFGDNRSIDTWTFIEGNSITLQTTVEVKIADLKVTEVTPNKTTVGIGDNLTYTIRVKNDGPSSIASAPFTFTLPPGLDPQSFTFAGNGCGTQSVVLAYNPVTRTYTSELNLPNGCEIIYTITLTVTSAVSPGNMQVQAAILRPNDVTDPDATNPNSAIPPTNAQYECANNGLGGICNNILNNNVVIFSPGVICTEPVAGENFSWSYPGTTASPVTRVFTQPATNYGFVLDIFDLDNSFNLEINGVKIAAQEIEFQSASTPGINVRFADGDEYEVDTQDIWQMSGTGANPLIRVEINPSGTVSLFGSKTSGGPLFPLELFNGNTLNAINWNSGGSNTIIATQNVQGTTSINGTGYGRNIMPCAPPCTKPVAGNDFSWSYNSSGNPSSPNGSQVQEIITQPGSNYGFVIDVYGLDNSFNMNINGTPLTTQEIQLWSGGTHNIRFKSDHGVWGASGISEIWNISGIASSPVIRVKINSSGIVTFYGKRTSNSVLEELELFNGNTSNTITWNASANNIITVGQTVEGATRMSGSGYGLNVTPCEPCSKLGATGVPDGFTKVGILTKQTITNSTINGSITTNWPENVPNGHIVLDSSSKGLVITHVTTAQRDAMVAMDGMIIYNTDLGCVQIYRGNSPGVDWSRTGWNCIERGCNE